MQADAPVDGAEDAVERPDQPFIAHAPVDGPMVSTARRWSMAG